MLSSVIYTDSTGRIRKAAQANNSWENGLLQQCWVLSMKLTWQTLRRTLRKTLKGFLKDYKSFQSLWGLASPAVGWIRRTGGLNERKNHGRGRRQHKNRCDRIRQVVCPLPYIAAGRLFTFRGKKGSVHWFLQTTKTTLKFKLTLRHKLRGFRCVGLCAAM